MPDASKEGAGECRHLPEPAWGHRECPKCGATIRPNINKELLEAAEYWRVIALKYISSVILKEDADDCVRHSKIVYEARKRIDTEKLTN